MLLTALDFPFCFLAVRYIGPARVGHAEHVIVSWIESVIPEPVKEGWRGLKEQVKGAVQTARGEEEAAAADGTVVASTPTLAGDGGADVALVQDGYADHGVIEAEAENAGDNASMSLHSISLMIYYPSPTSHHSHKPRRMNTIS